MNNTSVKQITLDQAEEIWNDISIKNHATFPMFSFEWYKTWLSVQGGEWVDYILLINDSTIAPFVRKENTIQFTHSYTDFNDLIGPKDIWDKILEFTKQDGVTNIELENIPADSQTVAYFQQAVQKYPQHITIEAAKTAPFITLPSTFEQYLATIKPKRRKYHKFQNENPNAIVNKSEQPEKDMDTFFTLLQTNPIKQASLTTQKEIFFREIITACKENIWMQLLRVDNQIISMLYMFIHDKTVMVYNSAFIKEQYPNAGTYLIIETIKQAIEQGYKELSLLSGREQYKYELGAKNFLLYSISCKL